MLRGVRPKSDATNWYRIVTRMMMRERIIRKKPERFRTPKIYIYVYIGSVYRRTPFD